MTPDSIVKTSRNEKISSEDIKKGLRSQIINSEYNPKPFRLEILANIHPVVKSERPRKQINYYGPAECAKRSANASAVAC